MRVSKVKGVAGTDVSTLALQTRKVAMDVCGSVMSGFRILGTPGGVEADAERSRVPILVGLSVRLSVVRGMADEGEIVTVV